MDSAKQEKPMVFYDIASAPPERTFAPNPWKARLALNFKSASYTTKWVELPDVSSTREALGVPASRKFPDGSDFNTLPILHDVAAGRFVGDSFDIALYLDEKYPDRPRLVAPGTAGVTKAWNDKIDQLVTRFVKLCSDGMPLKPEIAEQCQQKFAERAQEKKFVEDIGRKMTWEDCVARGNERTELLAGFKAALGELEAYYAYADAGSAAGPFLNGQHPIYADLIVAGWLGYAHGALRAEEVADLQTWHNGRWGNIWKSLAQYTEIR